MSDKKPLRGRLRASYFTSTMSMMLVLFVLGLLGLIVLHAQKLSDYVRENISVSLLLQSDASDEMILDFRNRLQKSPYIKSSVYITREQAAKDLSKELGEDFVKFIGYNPLPASIDLQLNAGYANTDSIARLEKILSNNSLVKEVVYQKPLIDQVNANIRKIGLILLGFSLLLLAISVLLINNTIRLSIHSKRFIIRTMQLVGATAGFIRKPFVSRGMLQGGVAALLAIGLLAGLLWIVRQKVPELAALQDWEEIGIFFGIVLVAGVFVAGVSTWFTVNKFLRMRVDHLYIQ